MVTVGIIFGFVAASCLLAVALSRSASKPPTPLPLITMPPPPIPMSYTQTEHYEQYSEDRRTLEQMKASIIQAQQMLGDSMPEWDAQVKEIDEKLAVLIQKEEQERLAAKDDVCPECGEYFALTDDYICEKCRGR